MRSNLLIDLRRAARVFGPVLLAGCAAGLAAAAATGGVDDTASQRSIIVPATPVESVVTPARPNQPPPAAQDLQESVAPGLLREGAFISNQLARVVQGKSGRWYAIFDQDGTGRALPPMILMESSSFASIQRAAERGSSRLRLTGRVSAYRDRNYLLATMVPQIERVEAPAAPATTPVSLSSPTPPSTSPKPVGQNQNEPSVDDIVAELEKAAPSARPASTPKASPSATGSTQSQASTGTETGASPMSVGISPAGFLASRKARVVRGNDGTLVARFDSGAEGKSEAPMTLLPCQNLNTIETILDGQGTGLNAGAESVTFTLSGQVQVHRGKNYLLVTMYIVNRPTLIVIPAQ